MGAAFATIRDEFIMEVSSVSQRKGAAGRAKKLEQLQAAEARIAALEAKAVNRLGKLAVQAGLAELNPNSERDIGGRPAHLSVMRKLP